MHYTCAKVFKGMKSLATININNSHDTEHIVETMTDNEVMVSRIRHLASMQRARSESDRQVNTILFMYILQSNNIIYHNIIYINIIIL